MSEKWLLSRCEGYAVRIDELTRPKHGTSDPHSTPRGCPPAGGYARSEPQRGCKRATGGFTAGT